MFEHHPLEGLVGELARTDYLPQRRKIVCSKQSYYDDCSIMAT